MGKTLVTGASGFIGLNIIETLVKNGEDVVVFNQGPIDNGDNTFPPFLAYEEFKNYPGKIIQETGDIKDISAIKKIVEKHRPEYVIHGAAITPGVLWEKKLMFQTAEVNFFGTMNLLEALKDFPPKRLVVLGSGAVYGDNAYDDPFIDENKVIPKPNNIYSITKYAAERLAIRYKEIYAMDIVVGRIGVVFGPWEWATGIRSSLSTILQLTYFAVNGMKAVMPDISGTKDWVYSRDIARGALALRNAKELRYDEYNISSGVSWSLGDWCQKLQNKFPDFDYSKSDNVDEVNCLYLSPDRPAMSIDRLTSDTDYSAEFELDSAFNDYMNWMEKSREFFDSSYKEITN